MTTDQVRAEQIASGMMAKDEFSRWLGLEITEIGLSAVLARLTVLQEEYGEDRYRPSPLLKRMAREGKRFYP